MAAGAAVSRSERGPRRSRSFGCALRYGDASARQVDRLFLRGPLAVPLRATRSNLLRVRDHNNCPTTRIAPRSRAHGDFAFHPLSGVPIRDPWLVAALLCPDDDTSELTKWVRAGWKDPRRIMFYLHPKTDPRSALKAWAEADLPVHSIWVVRDWKELHWHFGVTWNVRVFDDFRGG